MNMQRVGKLLAFLLILPAVVLAQNGVVRGRIADAAGAPLARAIVSAEGSGLHATSDEQGRYEIRGLSSGAYLLRVRLLGYQPRTARVVVDQAAVTQDFVLTEQPISLSPVDVVVGSRARHTAAEQLAVPVDVFTSEDMTKQGVTETGQILQSLAPSVNFPHQSVTDANDIVRPFTLRGLSPDETLVLINGWRRHQMALVNTFAYGMGATDSIVNGRIIVKRNAAPQPNHHWGDGLEKDIVTMANFRLPLNDKGTTEFYSFGGWSYRKGTGNGYRRCAVDCASFIQGRNWPQIYPFGYLPEFAPNVLDNSIVAGIRTVTSGWSIDLGTSYGHNRFDYHIQHSLNVSLGPCLDPANPCAPGPDSTLGTADDIANQTSFFAGR